MQIISKFTSLVGAIVFLSATNSWALLIAPVGDISENSSPFQGNPIIDTHYQQIYNSNLFSGATYINSFSFFAWSSDTKISQGDYEFRLSTTGALVNALDTTDLNNNIGSDVTTFSFINLSGSTSPKLTITGAPFMYDPSKGNLLLEILVGPVGFSSGGFGGFQTGNGTFGDSSSRASNWVSGYNSYGLVTEFNLTAVPAPSILTLISLGLLFMIGSGQIKTTLTRRCS